MEATPLTKRESSGSVVRIRDGSLTGLEQVTSFLLALVPSSVGSDPPQDRILTPGCEMKTGKPHKVLSRAAGTEVDDVSFAKQRITYLWGNFRG